MEFCGGKLNWWSVGVVLIMEMAGESRGCDDGVLCLSGHGEGKIEWGWCCLTVGFDLFSY